MSNLVVLAMDTESGAQEMQHEIRRLQQANLITLEDAAIVTRHMDGKAKVHQLNSLVGAGAFGGAFWGMLIGLLFFMPWLGLAAGAITGALAGKFADIGVDDNFIRRVSESIPPGSSALFLMVRDASPDRVLEEIGGNPHVEVLYTSLSREDEEKLREAFATPVREAA
jgi:uncharacterized membrane protein